MKNNLFEALLEIKNTKTKTEKQQKIVETTVNLFAEKGYSNTSTAEIAKAAGVSEGIIFKHYGTKENLLLAVLIPFIKDFLPEMADEVFRKTFNDNTLTFEQFFRGFLKDRADFLLANREIFRILIKEMMYREDLRKELLPYFAGQIVPRFKAVLEAFKSRGDLADRSTDSMLSMMLTFISGFFVSRFVVLDNFTVSEEDIEQAVKFAMDGIGKGA